MLRREARLPLPIGNAGGTGRAPTGSSP